MAHSKECRLSALCPPVCLYNLLQMSWRLCLVSPKRRGRACVCMNWSWFIVLLYKITLWLAWMNPIPPMSAASMKHQSILLQALRQFFNSLRSKRRNSEQNSLSLKYSFRCQSATITYFPSSWRRFARWLRRSLLLPRSCFHCAGTLPWTWFPYPIFDQNSFILWLLDSFLHFISG